MKLLIQKVKKASIEYENGKISSISKGLLVYVGIEKDDDINDVDLCVRKLINLRVFEDDKGKMNLSSQDLECEFLVVSSFTLVGNFKKGNRPSFDNSKNLDEANKMFNDFVFKLQAHVKTLISGEFRTHMNITSENDGPINLIFDSKS